MATQNFSNKMFKIIHPFNLFCLATDIWVLTWVQGWGWLTDFRVQLFWFYPVRLTGKPMAI